MALPVGVTRLGSFKGNKGDKGDTGSIAYATAETVPAGEPADAIMVGDESFRGAHFKIPAGLPGVNAVENDAAVAEYVGSPTADTHKALMGGYVSAVVMFGDGIDPTGATDSTAAMQAVIDANPNGRIFIPEGVYQFTQLYLNAGQYLIGAGRSTYRDRYGSFGTVGWMDPVNFGGTVLRSTEETGAAITLSDPVEVTEGGIAELSIIGPGTGTSTGVSVGSLSPAKSIVNPQLRNVMIGNFSFGLRMAYVNEGDFQSVIVRGCETGVKMDAFVLQNAFKVLDVQRCGLGMEISADSYANSFHAPVFQSNSGDGVHLRGQKNTFYNPYFENQANDHMIVFGHGNHIDAAFQAETRCRLIVNAGALDNEISNVGWQGSFAAVVDNGTRTRLSGRLQYLTGSPVKQIALDADLPGSAFGFWQTYGAILAGTGWNIGNGVIDARYTRIGRTVHFKVMITFGSTSTFGSASPTITAPFAPLSRGSVNALALRQGVGTFKLFPRFATTGSAVVTVGALGANGQSAQLTASSPAAWANGDTFEIYGTYDAAA